jgi:hypothetical protein
LIHANCQLLFEIAKLKGKIMEIDWNLAKKITLWHYDDLIEKIFNVFAYDFVQEYYNHDMEKAAIYSKRLHTGYTINEKEVSFIGELCAQFKSLGHTGVKDYLDFVQRIKTKTDCEDFLKKVNLNFETMIHLLNYLFRWVLPFKCPMKELVETITPPLENNLTILKKFNIRFNLDILEKGRTKQGRMFLVKESGMTETYIDELTNRADISRLAYVRGKTIKHLCGGGYNTLEKIAAANIKKMETDMTEYYATTGKNFADFKKVIPLDWMIGGAKVLPKIVEY